MGSKELLEGCESCGSRFFFYIREEQLESLRNKVIEIPEQERVSIEKDIREMAGITDENEPVILDIESVRAVGPGKYEIDVVNLFNKERPLIYKLEEGKYIIDLASTLKDNLDSEKIVD
jgi:predicted  nucleic acid-binding Zn-ribbon protein